MNFSPSLKTLDELAVDFQDEDYYLFKIFFLGRDLHLSLVNQEQAKLLLCFKLSFLVFLIKIF